MWASKPLGSYENPMPQVFRWGLQEPPPALTSAFDDCTTVKHLVPLLRAEIARARTAARAEGKTSATIVVDGALGLARERACAETSAADVAAHARVRLGSGFQLLPTTPLRALAQLQGVELGPAAHAVFERHPVYALSPTRVTISVDVAPSPVAQLPSIASIVDEQEQACASALAARLAPLLAMRLALGERSIALDADTVLAQLREDTPGLATARVSRATIAAAVRAAIEKVDKGAAVVDVDIALDAGPIAATLTVGAVPINVKRTAAACRLIDPGVLAFWRARLQVLEAQDPLAYLNCIEAAALRASPADAGHVLASESERVLPRLRPGEKAQLTALLERVRTRRTTSKDALLEGLLARLKPHGGATAVAFPANDALPMPLRQLVNGYAAHWRTPQDAVALFGAITAGSFEGRWPEPATARALVDTLRELADTTWSPALAREVPELLVARALAVGGHWQRSTDDAVRDVYFAAFEWLSALAPEMRLHEVLKVRAPPPGLSAKSARAVLDYLIPVDTPTWDGKRRSVVVDASAHERFLRFHGVDPLAIPFVKGTYPSTTFHEQARAWAPILGTSVANYIATCLQDGVPSPSSLRAAPAARVRAKDRAAAPAPTPSEPALPANDVPVNAWWDFVFRRPAWLAYLDAKRGGYAPGYGTFLGLRPRKD